LTAQIVNREAFNVIGLRFSGPFSALGVEMPKLWQTFVARIPEIPGAVQPNVRYDIADEDHTYQMFTQFICVEVKDFSGGIPQGMVGFQVPGRTYAVFRHSGPMAGVPQTYANAFAWLKENGHEFDPNALRFEEYEDGVEDAYNIWLPVK
jgi:AraC family transcriptional regulator